MTTAVAEMEQVPVLTGSDEEYVILHNGVGDWKKGDVVKASQIVQKKASPARLVASRAMRPATELEQGQQHVDLEDVQTAQSYQHIVAEKDREIARLRTRVAELEEEKAHRHQNVIAANQRGDSALIEEKDRTIRDLLTKLKEANTEIAVAAQQTIQHRVPTPPPQPQSTQPQPNQPKPPRPPA